MTIGRSENCTVQLDPLTEKIASKQHAYIEVKHGDFYLVDNKSSNGTFLNGQKVQIAKLNAGDRLQLGKGGVEAIINLETDEFLSEPTQIKPSFEPPLAVQPVIQTDLQPNMQSNSQPASVTEVLPLPTSSWQNSITGLSSPKLHDAGQANQTGKYIGIAAAIFLVIFLSLIVSLLMFASVGVGAAVGASIVAFVPAMFYLLPLIWLDRYDPEPLWLLALAFAWGALVAVIVSFIINTLLGSLFGDAFGAVVSAPIFEEGSKGLGLVLLLVFFRRYFDDILDGIVFAGVIALGFATVENVLYYGRGIVEGGSNVLIFLFVLRGVMSPFAHVSFTAMTGIGCGIARESHKTAVRILLPIIGYGTAVFLHALWNGMATVGGLGGFFLGYLILEVPFFLIFVGFAFYTMYRQNKILKEMLAIDVARGLIPQDHLDIATSAFRSSFWILGSLLSGKFKARNSYLRAVGKLGLTYWHIQRATAAQSQTASFQQNPLLRDEVVRWRDKV